MEAISNAGAAIGLLAKDGVVLVAEKKITSKVRGDRGSLGDCTRDCTVGGHAHTHTHNTQHTYKITAAGGGFWFSLFIMPTHIYWAHTWECAIVHDDKA